METPKISLLRNALQAYTWRTQALTSNIANMETPGFKRLSVAFEDALQTAYHNVPGARHLEDVKPEMTQEERPPQLEDEMMELADTQMRNQLAARALSGHFDALRTGITGRIG